MPARRICVFCERWESGGIESFLCNVLSRIDRSDLEIDLVAAQLDPSMFTQPLKDCGVHFYRLSGTPKKLIENHRMFRSLLQTRQYDVVYLNVFQGMSLYYAYLAKKAGVPVRIAHSHNTDLRRSPTRAIKLWLHHRYSQRYAKDATAFWACSQGAAEFMFPPALLQARGYTFIPNGIDTNRFRFAPAVREAVRQELGIADCFVVGNVGRLCYQKNQSFLLDVLAEAIKLQPNCRLLLVGEGEDRRALEAKAAVLGLSGHVIFYGTSNRVETLLWAMDTLAFSSRFEGLPVVAVEAQAAGLPMVCSEHITRQAFISPDIQQLSLSAGAAVWAAALLNCAGSNRDTAHESVRNAGFDITQVACRVEKALRGNVK